MHNKHKQAIVMIEQQVDKSQVNTSILMTTIANKMLRIIPLTERFQLLQ